MSERRRPGRTYTKIILILIFVIFPLLFLAVHIKTNARTEHNDPYDPRNASPVIGIDLSDDYIRMAYVRVDEEERETKPRTEHKIEILTDSDGRSNIPTALDCPHEEPIVGDTSSGIRTVTCEEIFSRPPKVYLSSISQGLPLPNDEWATSLGNATASVLRRMKAIATTHFSEEVKYAVVTIPAYFNDAQRAAIRDGGNSAGLEIIRLVNAPTAAGLAYNLDKSPHYDSYERNVVVFDLGTRGIDVTVMVIEEGVFEILATSHKGTYGSRWIMDSITNDVTRAKPEGMLDPVFSASIDLINDALVEAQLKVSDINDLLLIGDATRIPNLKETLEETFSRQAIEKGDFEADQAVAIGAALQGYIMSSDMGIVGGCPLMDIYTANLSVEVAGGAAVLAIHAGTVIPTQTRRNFTTVRDGQTRADVKIYEEQDGQPQDVIWVLSLEIPPALRGVPTIEVMVAVGPDRGVVIEARHTASGKIESFQRLPNGTVVLPTSPNQTEAKGGEIAVANVMHLSDSHEEL